MFTPCRWPLTARGRGPVVCGSELEHRKWSKCQWPQCWPSVTGIWGNGESAWHRFRRLCLLPFSGFGVPIKSVALPSAASDSIFTDAKDANQMPNIDVATPVSSAPSDRLALSVGWVRPGVASIGGTVNPSSMMTMRALKGACFEGSDE